MERHGCEKRNLMEIVIETLELLFSAFLLILGYKLSQEGKTKVRATLVACAGIFACYWAFFLPQLIYLRLTGKTDIGKMTILREAFCLHISVVPFAGYIGGAVLALLMMLVLTRIPKVSRAFSVFLYIVMPVTLSKVLEFYAPLYPNLCVALENLRLGVCCVGAGCVLAQANGTRKADASKWIRAVIMLVAFAGHYLLPTLTLGQLQLAGNRVDFTFDLDMIYVPAMLFAWTDCLPIFDLKAPQRRAGQSYFKRETTDVVKGFAIVMMSFFHFYAYPDWYVSGVAYPEFAEIVPLMRDPLGLCMTIYAFITGYFYSIKEKKSIRYSLSKIWELLSRYWLITSLLFVMTIAAGEKLTLADYAWELIALKGNVMCFNWYIVFYVMAMLALPFMARIPHGNLAGAAALYILAPVMFATALTAFFPGSVHAQTINFCILTGCCALGSGYLTARFSLYERVLDRILGNNQRRRLFLSLILGVMAFWGRQFAPRIIIPLDAGNELWNLRISMDMLYTPVLVYAIVNLVQGISLKWIWRGLAGLGKYSMQIWLVSCLFFGAAKETYQPVLYAPRHPVMVILWGLLICYAAGRVIEIAAKFMADCIKYKITLYKKGKSGYDILDMKRD